MNFESIDWAMVQAFFKLEKTPTFWDAINSPFFVTVVVGLLGLVLQRRIRRDIETTTEVQRTIQRTNENMVEARPQIEQIEAIIENAQPAGTNVPDFREEAKGIVQGLKDKINALIARDTDMRHHRVYERIGRTDYKLLVQALFERDQLGFRAAGALTTAFSWWDAYSRGKAHKKVVPQQVIDLLNQARAALEQDL